EAGLDTQIVEYKVLLSFPEEISVDVIAPADVKMHGPSRERVDDDPYQDDPRVLPPYNAYSPSGDAEAEVVYVNFGSPQDYKQLEAMKVDVRSKIVMVRYGGNYRGVKSLVAQEHGAAGVIIYSDPIDDGFYRGDMYPKGPFRPATGVQRGSVDYTFKYAGDPTTLGIASLPSLPDSQRTSPAMAADLPKSGVKPKRTMVVCSWDGEEEGMIGSTEWGEQHAQELQHAVAYLNMDVGVAGPNFGASAVPALKQFVRDATKQVARPKGGTVYQAWKDTRE